MFLKELFLRISVYFGRTILFNLRTILAATKLGTLQDTELNPMFVIINLKTSQRMISL